MMVELTKRASDSVLEKRLRFLASRLRWRQYWRLIWDNLLTDDDRASVSVPDGKRPDLIYLWANRRSVTPPVAALELALEVDLITAHEHSRLLNALQQSNGSSSETKTYKLGSGHKDESRRKDGRRMRSAELGGKHVHKAGDGRTVNIWTRRGKFIARGSLDGKQYGVTLGTTVEDAEQSLRNVLVELERDSFVPPSDAQKQYQKKGVIPRLAIPKLCNRYLTDVRSRKGQGTADTYEARLKPLITFADLKETKRRWSMAADVDREFVVAFRKWLHTHETTRNGHPSSKMIHLSARQIYNVLDCCRTMFGWAPRPEVAFLPSTFVQPFTKDLVGQAPRRNPVRKNPFPMKDRIALISVMDAWKLGHFGLSMVIPQRPDELAGALISDVNFEERQLEFGTRMGGADFNKGRLNFTIPFPAEIEPLLRHCIADRGEGPLFRRRPFAEGNRRPKVQVNTQEELQSMFNDCRRNAKDDDVQTEQDLKRLFRRMLHQLGGFSRDTERKSVYRLMDRAKVNHRKRYELREAITTEMREAGIADLALRYLTSHAVKDVLNAYVSIDPHKEMAKYFDAIQPLRDAIRERAGEVGIT